MSALIKIQDAENTCGTAYIHLRLTAPRANALEPVLLGELDNALDRIEASDAQIVLMSGGRNFSSGGDVAGFATAIGAGRGQAYADRVVPALQRILLRMIGMNKLFVVAAHGAITGGSAGFLFASDLAVLSPDAFVQPYYCDMGFGPDGGWTALLTEAVGAGRALAWQLSNQRITAQEAVTCGLAAGISDDPETAVMARIAGKDMAACLATKAMIWDAPRRALVADRLAAETAEFRRLIQRDETLRRITQFQNGQG